MKYNLGDRFIVNNLEGRVSFVNSKGDAYLVPVKDKLEYNGEKLLMGCVFAVLNNKGLDGKGNKAQSIKCGAI